MRILGLIKQAIEARMSLALFFAFVSLGGLVLVIGRQFIPVERAYLFLIWNFFLAGLPLCFSSLLLEVKKQKRPLRYTLALSFLWMIFLPNAPYMLTDFIHLTLSSKRFIWLDMFTISWFAIFAFVAAVISLNDISSLLAAKYSGRKVYAIIFCICVLTGFGIYLGRDLRFNSWDIIFDPWSIISGILSINPMADRVTLVTGSGIGFLLFVFYAGLGIIRRELKLDGVSANKQ